MRDEAKAYAAADKIMLDAAMVQVNAGENEKTRDALALAWTYGMIEGLQEGRDVAIEAFDNLAKAIA